MTTVTVDTSEVAGETLAYIAGVLDADGYFSIKRSTYNLRVIGDAQNPVFSERIGIKQVKPEAVDLIYGLFGGYRSIEKPSAKNGQPLHSLQVTNAKAAALARAVLPHLRIKREQCEILLELTASRSQRRRVYGQPGMQNTRWGPRLIRRKVNAPEVIAERVSMFERIRSLNDTRNHQAKL